MGSRCESECVFEVRVGEIERESEGGREAQRDSERESRRESERESEKESQTETGRGAVSQSVGGRGTER